MQSLRREGRRTIEFHLLSEPTGKGAIKMFKGRNNDFVEPRKGAWPTWKVFCPCLSFPCCPSHVTTVACNDIHIFRSLLFFFTWRALKWLVSANSWWIESVRRVRRRRSVVVDLRDGFTRPSQSGSRLTDSKSFPLTRMSREQLWHFDSIYQEGNTPLK